MGSHDDSLLEKIANRIPGYGAYRVQEARRNDDRLTRDFLSDRLQDCKSKLDQAGKDAVAAGDLDTPAKLEALRDQVDRAQRRIEAAVEGYSGWFSNRKIDEEVLIQVCEHDDNLIALVDQLDSLLSDIQVGSNSWNDAVDATNLLHERIDRRADLLKTGSA